MSNYEIANILCGSLLMAVCVIGMKVIEYRFDMRLKERQEKTEEEREREREREEKEKKQLIDKKDKRKEFYKKICSKNYDYVNAKLFYKKRFHKNEDAEEAIFLALAERIAQRSVLVEQFAFREVLEENFSNVGTEWHLITICSLRNREGIARKLQYIMVVPKAYDKKEYFEGIQKLLKKELGLYAKVSELSPTGRGKNIFNYKGYYVNALDRDEVVLISEVGFVKTFDKISDCISNIEYL